jgi:hypothetical protein
MEIVRNRTIAGILFSWINLFEQILFSSSCYAGYSGYLCLTRKYLVQYEIEFD